MGISRHPGKGSDSEDEGVQGTSLASVGLSLGPAADWLCNYTHHSAPLGLSSPVHIMGSHSPILQVLKDTRLVSDS